MQKAWEYYSDVYQLFLAKLLPIRQEHYCRNVLLWVNLNIPKVGHSGSNVLAASTIVLQDIIDKGVLRISIY